jgi:hypothetical protein
MRKAIFCTAIVLVLGCALGCSTLFRSQSDAEGRDFLTTNATQHSKAPAYQFDDVQVPSELELQSDESFIMQTPHVKAGALVYTGWVDPVSLSSFYLRTMPEAGWSPMSYFTYGHYLMVFQKPEKVCVVRIHKGRLTTRLEIWVSPAISNAENEFSQRVLPQ